MERRTANQIKVYGLILNTFGSAESGELVALASSEESLKKWYESQYMKEPEIINGYRHTFKEGSVIRRNNPLFGWNHADTDPFRHGWFSEWVNEENLNKTAYRVDF